MRWQRPYVNVPMDDYVTSPRYQKLSGSGGKPPQLYDLIGPHEFRSLNLMKLRRKPVALVLVRDLEFWIESIIEHGWKVIQLPQDIGNPQRMRNWEILVYLPDQRWRAEKIIRILKDESGRCAQVKLGYLLGYTKRCIKAFLERTALLDKVAVERARILKDPTLNTMGEIELLQESQIPPDLVMP